MTHPAGRNSNVRPIFSPSTDPSDLYATDSGGYSVDDFYPHSIDDKGSDSSAIQTKVSNVHLEIIDQLVQSKDAPAYTSKQAFIRDAIHHRLEWLKEHRKDLVDLVGQRRVELVRAMAVENAVREEQKAFAKWLKDLSENLEVYERSENVRQIEATFERVMPRLKQLDDADRAQVEKVLGRYRWMLSSAEEGRDG